MWNRARRRPTGRIRLAKLHSDAFESDGAIICHQDADRLAEKAELYTLELREVVFVRVRRHFAVCSTVNHGHTLGSKAVRDCDAIDGGIASADHRDVSSDLHRAGINFALLDVGQSVEDVLL